jgi:hypothetical protein
MVLILFQQQVSKYVLKMSAFRLLDDLFRSLRRDKDHTAIPSKDHISRHYQDLANAGWPVVAHHG